MRQTASDAGGAREAPHVGLRGSRCCWALRSHRVGRVDLLQDAGRELLAAHVQGGLGVAQTKLGAAKVVARKAGMSLRAYLDRVARGFKYCWRCDAMHRDSDFGKDSSRYDGLASSCRDARGRRQRELFRPSMKPTRHGPRRIPRRDGDKKQARSRIYHDVRQGLRPAPASLPCHDCGHLGRDRRHEYDHFLGYAAEHHGDVQPVCSRCHGIRGRARREACARGHRFTPENTLIYRGQRSCRACRRIRETKTRTAAWWRARKKRKNGR